MYTGSYFDGDAPSLPKGYDGCAFGGSQPTPSAPLEARYAPPKVSPISVTEEPSDAECENEKEEESQSVGLFSSLFSRIPLKGFSLGTLGGPLAGLVEKITAEEILLLGVALILFFSPDGDRTLSLLLLALLFVN